ncbi:MAG: hypothetical protein CMP53_02405 [Flavobacteriales bacterium]|jgi:hypothetical protein|nr:hypothetical protein [Flavobacteriales bacterium]|tara:strand:- start:1509 stop:2264 length:756 start_codon:yes stop_codon:yes gene_type:complete
MNMNRFLVALAFLGFLGVEANAQAVIVRKRQLNTDSGTNPSVRYSPSSSSSRIGNMYYSRYNHAIKISPAALIAGEIPISYELKVSDYLTVEAGLGITTYNVTEDLIRGYSVRGDGETVSKVSYSTLFNTKFFPEGNSFQDGYYIAFNLNLRNYVQDFTTLDNFGTDTTVNEFFRWADIGFTTGLQSRPSEKMIIDWYIGAGIRQKNRSTTDYEQVFDPISGIYQGQYILQQKTSVAPALLGGVKISLLFR